MAKYQSPIEKEIIEKSRFVFVADFVTKMTRKKADRELTRGYQVKRQKGQYTIIIDGQDVGYGRMTAETINSWFPRLPLNYFAMQAEQMIVAIKYDLT